MITQAAFGYALVGLETAPWVRPTHLVLGIVVLVLVILVTRATRRLPWTGPREGLLAGLSPPLLVLVLLQWVMGLMARGILPGWSPEVRVTHVGIGLLVTLLVVVVHVLAIGPSLLLSARRELESARATRDDEA